MIPSSKPGPGEEVSSPVLHPLRDVHRRYATELLILLRMDEEELPHEPGATVAEHEELLAALSLGPEAAEAAFRAHLEDARQRVAAYVRGGGSSC